MKEQKRGSGGGWQGGRQGYKRGNQGGMGVPQSGKGGNRGGVKKYKEKTVGKTPDAGR